jgi:hypothetical protein
MKKVVELLVMTPENVYGKKKKHVQWVMVVIKAFLHLSPSLLKSGKPHF